MHSAHGISSVVSQPAEPTALVPYGSAIAAKAGDLDPDIRSMVSEALGKIQDTLRSHSAQLAWLATRVARPFKGDDVQTELTGTETPKQTTSSAASAARTKSEDAAAAELQRNASAYLKKRREQKANAEAPTAVDVPAISAAPAATPKSKDEAAAQLQRKASAYLKKKHKQRTSLGADSVANTRFRSTPPKEGADSTVAAAPADSGAGAIVESPSWEAGTPPAKLLRTKTIRFDNAGSNQPASADTSPAPLRPPAASRNLPSMPSLLKTRMHQSLATRWVIAVSNNVSGVELTLADAAQGAVVVSVAPNGDGPVDGRFCVMDCIIAAGGAACTSVAQVLDAVRQRHQKSVHFTLERPISDSGTTTIFVVQCKRCTVFQAEEATESTISSSGSFAIVLANAIAANASDAVEADAI